MFKETRRGIQDDEQNGGGDIIHLCILEFLEGYNPTGPSINTFKLAMLNKKMMTIVKYIYSINDFRELAVNEAR